jgi:hypothetical protein
MGYRYHIQPGDGPASVAAKRLGITEIAFTRALPDLRRRGFPAPDPTTGLFDLTAIDEWRRRRHPQVYTQEAMGAMDARLVVRDRLAGMMNDGPH